MNNPELSLAVPLYNEEANVAGLLGRLTELLAKNKINYEILAVDNGSIDRTGELITKFARRNKMVRKVVVKVNKGYGNGVLKGLEKCRGDFVGFLWGDNQISLNIVVKVFKKLKRDDLDICKVARVSRTEGFLRRTASFFYNACVNFLFGIDSIDMNGCPKIMKYSVFRALNLTSKDWFLDAEIMIKAKRLNFSVGEVPVESNDRKAGKSSVNFLTALEFAKNIFKYRFFFNK